MVVNNVVDFSSPKTLLILADETTQLARMCRDSLAKAYSTVAEQAIVAASEILLIDNEVFSQNINENVVDRNKIVV